MKWNTLSNTVYYGTCMSPDLKNNKIAGFDLDFTLIKPKGKRKMPKSDDENDFEILYNNIKKILKKLIESDYRIIIHTNQKNLKHPDVWKKKVNNVLQKLNVSCEVYVSLGNDLYRKPLTGVWTRFIKVKFHKKSFYCGDAVGRLKDHSDTDLKLALNLGINFILPETLFLDKEVKIPPVKYIKYETKVVDDLYYLLVEAAKSIPTLILFVGFPGCGKTAFYFRYLEVLKYKRISQDILKTKQKCMNLAKSLLQENKNIVIDNTSMDSKTRKLWYGLAEAYNAKILVVHFTTPLDICKHNNIFRHVLTRGKVPIVPDVVYRVMNKRREEPIASEGMLHLYKIKFSAKLIDEEEETLYKQYMY